MPRVGDRVMVEASYNPSMPFKWNAYRIQLVQQDNTMPPMQQKQQVQPPARPQPPPHQHPQPVHQQQQQHNGSSMGGRWADRMPREDSRPMHMQMDRRPIPQARRSPPRADSFQSKLDNLFYALIHVFLPYLFQIDAFLKTKL